MVAVPGYVLAFPIVSAVLGCTVFYGGPSTITHPVPAGFDVVSDDDGCPGSSTCADTLVLRPDHTTASPVEEVARAYRDRGYRLDGSGDSFDGPYPGRDDGGTFSVRASDANDVVVDAMTHQEC
jgi:hypothetical protein